MFGNAQTEGRACFWQSPRAWGVVGGLDDQPVLLRGVQAIQNLTSPGLERGIGILGQVVLGNGCVVDVEISGREVAERSG